MSKDPRPSNSDTDRSNDSNALYQVVRLADLPAIACPCGSARRAFQAESGGVASMHIVQIKSDSQRHYHKRTTEFYYVLEGEGEIEVDDRRVSVAPGTAVMIKPGCRHRAIGRLTILNVPVPAFDPDDEWFD